MHLFPNSSDQDYTVVPFDFYQEPPGESENPIAEAGYSAKTYLTVAKWFASRSTVPKNVGQIAAQLIRFKPGQVVTEWTGLPGGTMKQTAGYDERGFRYDLGDKKIFTKSNLPPGHRPVRVDLSPPEQLLERWKDSSAVRVLSKTANIITKALNSPAGRSILKGGTFGINCLCAYDPSQEDALARAIADGTAVFTISTVQMSLLKEIGSAIGLESLAKFNLVLSLGMLGSMAAADPHYDRPKEDVDREAFRTQQELTEKFGVLALDVYGPVMLDYGMGNILRWFSPTFVAKQMQEQYPWKLESYCLENAPSIEMLNTALKDLKPEEEFPGIFHPSFDPTHFLKEPSFDLPFPPPATQKNRREPVITEIKQRKDYEESEDFAERVTRIEENFGKLKKIYSQVLEEAPVTSSSSYGRALSSGRTVNLDTLQPVPSVTSTVPTNQYINLNLLDQCSLPWKVTQSATSSVMSLQTSMELPLQDLDALQALPLETPTDSLASPIADVESIQADQMQWPETSSVAPQPKAPSFGELAQITHMELGEGIGGGAGLVCTLASGAKVSLSTTGNAILTGMSVPLAKGFGMGLQTGLPYSASAAALLIGIHQLLRRKDVSERSARHQIRRDAQKTESDVNNANKTLEDFDLFLEQFQRGEIDKKAFTDRVNHISEDLQRSARKMGDRGKFAEGHRQQTPEGGFRHFFEKTKLRQLDLELKKLTEEAFVKREVTDHFTPQLREKPLQALVKDLLTLSGQRVLSLQQKYEQSALLTEISSRSKSEDLDVLQHLDSLTTHPVAISLNPSGVVKPEYIKSRYFNSREHSQTRQRERVKEWANDLQHAYAKFQEAAKTGDVGAIERAARDVFYQIDRTDGRHDINIRDYELKSLKGGPTETTAYKYYENFINSIVSNTKDTLAKAQEAQNAGVSDVYPAYFTAKEIQDLKIQSANNAYNKALTSLNSETATAADKDVAFAQMVKASKILESQDVVDPKIQNVLTIGAEHGSYSKYQEALVRQSSIESGFKKLMETTKQFDEATSPDEQSRLFALIFDETTSLLKLEISEADIRKIANNEEDVAKILAQVHSIQEEYPQYKIATTRLKGLKSSLETLQATTKKMEAENVRPKEYKRLYGEAFEIAKKLLQDGLSEADIRRLIGKDEDPQIHLNWVQSIREGYPNFIRIGEYQNRTLPLVATPASRFVLTVFNDSLRYDRPRINSGIQVFSSLHSLMPNLLPAAMNYLIARGFGENVAVIHGLRLHCLNAVQSNALSGLKRDLLHRKEFFHKPFVKQAPGLLGANAVIQVFSKALAVCTPDYLKDSPAAENLNRKVQNTAMIMSGVSNTAHTASTLTKTYKYISTATFGLKAHKLGQGILGIGMTGFDIYEFLATNPAEFGLSQEFVTTVQDHLPSFHGNLPENTHYYMGKDALFTLTLASASLQAPLLMVTAAVQGVSSLFHYYKGKYKDDVLAAAMINLRYFSKLPDSEQKTAAIKASYKNLISYLDNDFVVDRLEPKIRQKAKQQAFEYHMTCLEEERNWDEILAQTKIVDEITDTKTICKFMPVNIDISESITPLLKHFNALINKMSADDRFGALEINKSLSELEHTSAYLNQYFEQLTPKEKERSSTYISWVKETLEAQKIQLLTNYCVFYVKGQLPVSPLKALERFDAIPVEQRTLVHWYALGVISHKLFLESRAPKLQDVQLFCFEHILAEISAKETRNCELSPFEMELKKVSTGILRELSGGISSSHTFWKETAHFTPVFKDMLRTNGKQKVLNA